MILTHPHTVHPLPHMDRHPPHMEHRPLHMELPPINPHTSLLIKANESTIF